MKTISVVLHQLIDEKCGYATWIKAIFGEHIQDALNDPEFELTDSHASSLEKQFRVACKHFDGIQSKAAETGDDSDRISYEFTGRALLIAIWLNSLR